MSSSSENNAKASYGLKMVSGDELLHQLGPEGRRTVVTGAQNTIATYEGYASRNPIETAHDNIQLRGNVNADKISIAKSSQEMDNVRKIGRLMERVEVLEAEKLALEIKGAELAGKNRVLKIKNTEFEDKQAKMVKLLTDE